MGSFVNAAWVRRLAWIGRLGNRRAERRGSWCSKLANGWTRAGPWRPLVWLITVPVGSRTAAAAGMDHA